MLSIEGRPSKCKNDNVRLAGYIFPFGDLIQVKDWSLSNSNKLSEYQPH